MKFLLVVLIALAGATYLALQMASIDPAGPEPAPARQAAPAPAAAPPSGD